MGFYIGVVALARGDTAEAVRRFADARRSYRQLFSPSHPGHKTLDCVDGILQVRRRQLQGADLLLRRCDEYERWGLASPLVVSWVREARTRLRG